MLLPDTSSALGSKCLREFGREVEIGGVGGRGAQLFDKLLVSTEGEETENQWMDVQNIYKGAVARVLDVPVEVGSSVNLCKVDTHLSFGGGGADIQHPGSRVIPVFDLRDTRNGLQKLTPKISNSLRPYSFLPPMKNPRKLIYVPRSTRRACEIAHQEARHRSLVLLFSSTAT